MVITAWRESLRSNIIQCTFPLCTLCSKKCVLSIRDPPPLCLYLGRHWCRRDSLDQAFPLHFCILQAIKNEGGRPGNEASKFYPCREKLLTTWTSSTLVTCWYKFAFLLCRCNYRCNTINIILMLIFTTCMQLFRLTSPTNVLHSSSNIGSKPRGVNHSR